MIGRRLKEAGGARASPGEVDVIHAAPAADLNRPAKSLTAPGPRTKKTTRVGAFSVKVIRTARLRTPRFAARAGRARMPVTRARWESARGTPGTPAWPDGGGHLRRGLGGRGSPRSRPRRRSRSSSTSPASRVTSRKGNGGNGRRWRGDGDGRDGRRSWSWRRRRPRRRRGRRGEARWSGSRPSAVRSGRTPARRARRLRPPCDRQHGRTNCQSDSSRHRCSLGDAAEDEFLRLRATVAFRGRVAQRESARFTRGRSLVRSQSRPSRESPASARFLSPELAADRRGRGDVNADVNSSPQPRISRAARSRSTTCSSPVRPRAARAPTARFGITTSSRQRQAMPTTPALGTSSVSLQAPNFDIAKMPYTSKNEVLLGVAAGELLADTGVSVRASVV